MAKSPLICTACGQIGDPKTDTPGSFLIELLLWLLFILPGLAYSIWRLSARRKVCRSCGGPALIPLESPRGQQLLREFGLLR